MVCCRNPAVQSTTKSNHATTILQMCNARHHCLKPMTCTITYLSIKARNLCLSVCLSVCVCVYMCSSNSFADKVQGCVTPDLFGLQPLINYFINARQIPQALSTIVHHSPPHTTVMCAPEPITAHHSHVRTRANHYRAQAHDIPEETSGFIPAAARAGPGFCRRFVPVLFCASKLTVVD